MQLRPSESIFVKRRLLNYLILFEAVLLICLTAVAVEARHVGEVVVKGGNLKEIILLIAFPVIWLCCLSLFGAWDLKILDNHIDGYRRLLRSSFMTFLTFSSASYLFKIQISLLCRRTFTGSCNCDRTCRWKKKRINYRSGSNRIRTSHRKTSSSAL